MQAFQTTFEVGLRIFLISMRWIIYAKMPSLAPPLMSNCIIVPKLDSSDSMASEINLMSACARKYPKALSALATTLCLVELEYLSITSKSLIILSCF